MTTEYGKRLKSARKHAGLTQMQASKALGIPQSTISTSERESSGSPDTPVYAKLYGVSAHWLATGEGEMLPPKHPDSLLPNVKTALDRLPSPTRRVISLRGKMRVLDSAGHYEEQALLESEMGSVVFNSQDPDAYALRVKGDQLHPVLRSGEILLVEPNVRSAPSDRVLVHLKDGTRLVRELIMVLGTEYVFEAVGGGHRMTVETHELHPENGLQHIGGVFSPRSFRPDGDGGDKPQAGGAPAEPPPPT